MTEISKTMCIEMGHRLPDHEGKCHNLHGHSYFIEVFVRGEIQTSGPESGMIIDYHKLKEAMKVIDELFDHKMCLCVDDPFVPHLLGFIPVYYKSDKVTASFVGIEKQKYILISRPPTAEVLAELWFNTIFDFVPGIYKITVKETATSTAIYQV